MNLQRRSNGFYYLTYYDEETEKWRKKSTKYTTKAEALKFFKKFSRELEEKQKPLPLIQIDEFEKEYLKFIGATHSSKYVESIKLSFRMLSNFLGADSKLTEINTKIAQQFISQTHQRAKQSSYLYLRTLKAAFNRAKDWEYILENPFVKVKLPRPQKQHPLFINEKELQEILSTSKNQNMVEQKSKHF